MKINLSAWRKVLLISVILSGLWFGRLTIPFIPSGAEGLITSTLWAAVAEQGELLHPVRSPVPKALTPPKAFGVLLTGQAEPEIVIIYLKDSTTIEGELVSYNETSYRIKVGNDIKEILWENIDKVEYKSDKLKESPSTSDKSADKPVSPTTSTKYTTFPVIFDDLATRFMTYPYKELVVVWIIDDSGSLEDDREAIKNNISNLLDAPILRDKKFLNMAVVGFGAEPKLRCGISRNDTKIKKAIMDVGTKGSGVENCMGAIKYSIMVFKESSLKKIFIIVTDEKGDDDSQVETVLEQLKKNNITVYVIGGEATFARKEGEEIYQTKTGEWVQQDIDSGMESVYAEVLDSYFVNTYLYQYVVGSSKNYQIKSGFGPYALSRLCVQTEGKYYFLKDPSYPENVMKSYQPDLSSVKLYEVESKNSILRYTITDILNEVNIDRGNDEWLRGIPRFIYNPNDVKTGLTMASNALKKFNDFIKKMESTLANITPVASNANKRWIANGELVMAQLYRGRFRLNQYLLALQEFSKRPDAFKPPLAKETATYEAEYYWFDDSPIRKGNFDNSQDDYKAQAENALDKVMRNHPNTPWSTLAQKLKFEDMYGLEVTRELYKKGEQPSEPLKPR